MLRSQAVPGSWVAHGQGCMRPNLLAPMVSHHHRYHKKKFAEPWLQPVLLLNWIFSPEHSRHGVITLSVPYPGYSDNCVEPMLKLKAPWCI